MYTACRYPVLLPSAPASANGTSATRKLTFGSRTIRNRQRWDRQRVRRLCLAPRWPIGQPRLTQSHASEDAMPNENHTTDLFEIIKTTRSMRRLKPDPVPNELIRKILEAGVCAP